MRKSSGRRQARPCTPESSSPLLQLSSSSSALPRPQVKLQLRLWLRLRLRHRTTPLGRPISFIDSGVPGGKVGSVEDLAAIEGTSRSQCSFPPHEVENCSTWNRQGRASSFRSPTGQKRPLDQPRNVRPEVSGQQDRLSTLTRSD